MVLIPRVWPVRKRSAWPCSSFSGCLSWWAEWLVVTRPYAAIRERAGGGGRCVGDGDDFGVVQKVVENRRSAGDVADEFAPVFQGAIGKAIIAADLI